jgi:acyl dehydratase
MRFADIHAGDVLHAGPRVVTEPEILEFAGRYDPQWFHTDPARANNGRWHGLIASGWHTCAIAMELIVGAVLKDSDSYGSPGIDNLKWLEAVRPGDALSLRVFVLETRASSSGKTGIVRWRWELWNQAQRQVLELTGTSLFEIGTEST